MIYLEAMERGAVEWGRLRRPWGAGAKRQGNRTPGDPRVPSLLPCHPRPYAGLPCIPADLPTAGPVMRSIAPRIVGLTLVVNLASCGQPGVVAGEAFSPTHAINSSIKKGPTHVNGLSRLHTRPLSQPA